MVDWDFMAKCASLAGTAMGIGLGITPIVPFYQIIRGKENVKIFPESMIFFNILSPHLWACYWIRQNNFIPFFSAIFGFVLALLFSTIYIYFYIGQNIPKWLLYLCVKFGVVLGFHYFLLFIVPSYHIIGTAAMLVGIFTSIAPAQNVLKVIRERNYKLIPIFSTIFGALCNFCWLLFGCILRDIYNIVPNGICLTINLSNTLIWTYFYCTRDKKDEKEEQLKDEEEH
jgi:uncharacterized protein with PQ loop repeat